MKFKWSDVDGKKSVHKEKKWNFSNTYARLPNRFYTKQNPAPVRNPKLIIFNESLADYLGVPMQPEVYAGNIIPEGAEPLAQAYAGHQFGHFTMLGDGRAVLLGEQVTSSGERFDIQLKGAGKTPYSRGGDGRAALGPMLREYIISEAMYGLGIPTTRSLAVVETGEMVRREKKLPGAILTRAAASHIRVGTFEYAARFGNTKDVCHLADYTIARHFPNIKLGIEANSETSPQSIIESSENKYLALLKEVVKRQAFLIARWQLVGFIHGVMNTDNMAISGETIDYGPCAFMDTYHPATVFSSIDVHGRYSYENQPKMASWNLARFAETLLPLLHDNRSKAIQLGQEAIASFKGLFQDHWLAGMRAKLGLCDEEAGDELLINDLLQLMQQLQADYTNTFRALTLDLALPGFEEWRARWQKRLGEPYMTLMKQHNPAIIPRNYFVEEALKSVEEGDLQKMKKFLHALANPYDYTPEQKEYSQWPDLQSCGYKTFCGT